MEAKYNKLTPVQYLYQGTDVSHRVILPMLAFGGDTPRMILFNILTDLGVKINWEIHLDLGDTYVEVKMANCDGNGLQRSHSFASNFIASQ